MKLYTGTISDVWMGALNDIVQPGVGELPGYVAQITEPHDSSDACRKCLDEHLARANEPSTETVANTIFPKSLWDPSRPREELYGRYEAIWPRVARSTANRHGVYFRRMTHFDGSNGPINQIETVIENYLSGNHRRSAMQISIYDPSHDLTNSRRRGFPCLQHVVLAPIGTQELQITAFYATQTVFNKAYGNFLGLVRLGQFFSHAFQLKLASVVCFTSIGLRGDITVKEAREMREQICAEVE